MVSFYTPRKYQKTCGFPMFFGGLEMEDQPEMN